MKRTVLAIVLIIAALIIGANLQAQEIEQPRRAVPQPQCVKVLVEDKDGRSGGTGALIGPRLIVTCNHVVKDKKNNRVEILFPDWQLIDGTVVKVDKKYDLALIKLDKAPLGIKPLYITALRPKEPLSVQGYGYGPYRQDWGVLHGSNWGVGWKMVQGAVARSGDSGGPVINKDGYYVGTLWGSAQNDGTYFTPASVVTKFASDYLTRPNNVDDDDDYDLSWRRWRRRVWTWSPFADIILRRAFS